MTAATSFEVEGMSCAACAGRVERAVKALPGVADAQVNLATRTLHTEFAGGAAPQAVAEAVAKAGYRIPEEEVALKVEGMSCASCVARIERALTAYPGVTEAHANLAMGEARVKVLAGSVTPAEIAGIVTRAGYPAVPQREAGPQVDRQAEEARALRRNLIVAAGLTLPVFLLAMGAHLVPGVHHLIAMTIGEQANRLIQFALTTLVLAGPGRVFLRHGVPALLRGAPDMNSLVALGAGAAWAYSTLATFAPGLMPAGTAEVYFEAAAVIVTLILLGRWLEARAKGRAGQAIARLVALRPETARVVRDGATLELPVEELRPGDLIEIRPGERIAADGEVAEGHSFVDCAMLTGEPLPVETGPGAAVTGGTVNGEGALTVRVTRTGEDSALARIIRMVAEAQGGKLPIQAVVDRVTLWFVPAVMAAAALTVLVWQVFGPAPVIAHALVAGVSVLIIACPCAMGLATPTSILVGTGRGAELGLLFRKGEALQRLGAAAVVAFDKTGTLTEGHPQLTDLILAEGVTRAEALALAAAVEAKSEHPIARAILAAAAAEGIAPAPVEGFRAVAGHGAKGTVGGRKVLVGALRLMTREGVELSGLGGAAAQLAQGGKTPLFLAVDGRLAAALAVADPVKPGARETIRALHALGVRTAMITGDARATAEHIAKDLGIDRVEAEVLPEGKVAAVKALAGDGPVAFVGDGINDAPALAAADVGVAIGTGTDVAIEAADVVLMSGDPAGVADAVRLSRATMRNIHQNLGWAFGYNVALIPLAAGVFYPLWGITLSPMIGAGAMAASSVLVVSNALRLRRFGRVRP